MIENKKFSIIDKPITIFPFITHFVGWYYIKENKRTKIYYINIYIQYYQELQEKQKKKQMRTEKEKKITKSHLLIG